MKTNKPIPDNTRYPSNRMATLQIPTLVACWILPLFSLLLLSPAYVAAQYTGGEGKGDDKGHLAVHHPAGTDPTGARHC